MRTFINIHLFNTLFFFRPAFHLSTTLFWSYYLLTISITNTSSPSSLPHPNSLHQHHHHHRHHYDYFYGGPVSIGRNSTQMWGCGTPKRITFWGHSVEFKAIRPAICTLRTKSIPLQIDETSILIVALNAPLSAEPFLFSFSLSVSLSLYFSSLFLSLSFSITVSHSRMHILGQVYCLVGSMHCDSTARRCAGDWGWHSSPCRTWYVPSTRRLFYSISVISTNPTIQYCRMNENSDLLF